MKSDHWNQLRPVAEEETAFLLNRLPVEIKAEIRNIPIIFEKKPSPSLVADGVEPDVMGLFVGDDYPHEGADPVATEIYLFLENIWDESGADMTLFREEIRKTLLHEWGHYLGLDENQLDERDLT